MLSGTNTFGGGTDVQAGLLIVTSAYGLESGTNLLVGAGAEAVFGTSVPPGEASSPVPEPGTLALLGAAVFAIAAYKSVRRPRRKLIV